MKRVKLADLGGYNPDLIFLGIKIADYAYANCERFRIIPDRGWVAHGPGSRSVQVRFSTDNKTYNIHEIKIRDSNSEVESRLTCELVNLYKGFRFTEMS